MVGDEPISVDIYVEKYGLKVPEAYGQTHHPLYDAAAALEVFKHLLVRRMNILNKQL